MIKEVLERIGVIGKIKAPNRMTQGFGADLGLTQVEEARVKLEIAKKSAALSKKIMKVNRVGKYV
jgi:hypothetical protein